MLELIGILTMVIDHIGKIFFPNYLLFRMIGRFSFVIYAYLLSIGALKTKDKYRYFIRILFIAFLTQFFYYNLISFRPNVCFTLAISLLIIIIYENNKIKKNLKYCYIGLLVILDLFFGCEYGLYGIIVILIFYFLRNKSAKCIIISQTINVVLCHFIFCISEIQYISLLAIIFVLCVGKREGWQVRINWKMKYLNYMVYPIHFMVLYIIKFILGD